MTHDIIIIGGGHNGLVAACYLAKAGLKALVLERRQRVGGVITEEIHPRFRCSISRMQTDLSPKIATDLDLARHGLEFIKPAARLTVLDPNGPSATIYDDTSRTVAALKTLSAGDAVQRVRKELRAHWSSACSLLAMTP